MAVYLILMAMVLILGAVLIEYRPTLLKKLCYVICVFVVMYLISVLRYGLGNDYYSYVYIFGQIRDTNGLDLFNCGYEPGFVLLTKLITLFTANTDIMYGIYALAILIPTAYAIFRYSENIWMSTMMFISLTFFYCSLSFIRQAIAFAIILIAYRYIKERNHVMVLLFIFFGCLFHTTAIILIPMYLLAVLIKPTKITLAVYTVLFALVYIFSWQILNLAVIILPQYKNYINLSFVQKGYSPIYLIVPAIIMLIAVAAHLTGYGKAYPKQSAVFTNLAIFNFFIWLVSTKHFVIERFSMYSYIMMIMFIPSVVTYYRKKLQIHLHQKRAKEAAADGRKIKRLRFDKTVDEVIRKKKPEKVTVEVAAQPNDEPMQKRDDERNRIIQEIIGDDAQTLQQAVNENTEEVPDNNEKYPADKKYLPENYKYRKTGKRLIDIIRHPAFSYATVASVLVVSCLWYNYFGLTAGEKGFHGVMPYRSNFPGYMQTYFAVEESGKDPAKLIHQETNLISYLYRLKNNERFTAFIVGRGDCVSGFNTGAYNGFKNVGFEKFLNLKKNQNYIAVISGGEVAYEDTLSLGSPFDKLEYTTEVDGKEVLLSSSIQKAVIQISGKDYSLSEQGINIVVYDNEKKAVVDKVRFKGYYAMLSATR